MPKTVPLSPAVQKVLAVQASAMFMAILDFALGNPEKRIDPQFTALAITSDGFLMGWNTAHPMKEGLIGSASDFERNLRGICAHAGLSADETESVAAQAYGKITDWRTSNPKGISPYDKASR